MIKKREILIALMVLAPLMSSVGLGLRPLTDTYTRAAAGMRQALENNDQSAEVRELKKLLEFMPWRGDLWKRTGRLYLNQNQLDSAILSFAQAEERGLLDSEGQVWLADALISNGQTEDAAQKLRSLTCEDPVLLLRVAELQAGISDYEGHRGTLLKAWQLAPQDPEINYQLGVNLLTLHPLDAVNHFTKARVDEAHVGPVDYLTQLINNLYEIRGSPEWFIFTGQALGRLGEWTAAKEAFENATRLSPKNANAWALLGESQQQVGQEGKASLEKALELDAGGELVNGMVALYYRRIGQPEKAIEYLEKAIDANPTAATWQMEIGNTLAEMGELEQAAARYRAATEIDPTDWVTWQNFAKFSITRNYEVSTIGLPAARRALTLNPGSPVLMDLLGTAYISLGDFDSAERFFQQALSRDPEEAAILIHLGQVYLYRGDQKTGFDYLRRATESADDNRLRDLANQLIREYGGE